MLPAMNLSGIFVVCPDRNFVSVFLRVITYSYLGLADFFGKMLKISSLSILIFRGLNFDLFSSSVYFYF